MLTTFENNLTNDCIDVLRMTRLLAKYFGKSLDEKEWTELHEIYDSAKFQKLTEDYFSDWSIRWKSYRKGVESVKLNMKKLSQIHKLSKLLKNLDKFCIKSSGKQLYTVRKTRQYGLNFFSFFNK